MTIGSLSPLRALTFRTVFVVGLDERVFPSAQGFGALDLRAAGRQPGDVTPREQDEYLFLETLLSARERLRLSYVRRDAVTGEQKDPSSVVIALCDVLTSGSAGDGIVRAITRASPPLARHEDDGVCAVIPAAARERQAVALGRSLRRAAGIIQLPDAGALGATLAPAAWNAMAPALGRVPLAAKPDAPRRAIESLTLADLRRFLECPLQGSVRVLLPMRDDEDAEDEAEAALRERENLGDLRVRTLPLLREVFGRAIDAGASDDGSLVGRYDEAVARLRLDGTLPSGLFGTVVRTQHLALLKAWREALRGALEGRLPGGLAPIWYGAAPEHRRDIQIVARDPTTVSLPDGPRAVSAVRPERAAHPRRRRNDRGDVDGNPPRRGRRARPPAAWLTHLALAASGANADRPLVSLALGATATVPPRPSGPCSAHCRRGTPRALLAAWPPTCWGVFTPT